MTAFRIGATTHVGQVRNNNQDSILAVDEQGLFAVADGMGGHRGGEVASEVAITTLQASFTEPSIDSLVEAVQSANDAVVTKADADVELRGMGTTLCVLGRIVTPDEYLAIANVGDSRLYLLRAPAEPTDEAGEPVAPIDPDQTAVIPSLNQEFEQVTEDHSLVATLVRQGQITKEEAEVHPHKNILTRALGIDARVMIDSWVMIPVKGDRYLICSDGLFNEVSEAEIARVLREQDDPQAASDLLVDMANAGGGRDNISVVIVEVTDDTGRVANYDVNSGRVARELHGSERAAADREIVDAVAGTSVAGAPAAPLGPPPPPPGSPPPPPPGVSPVSPAVGANGRPARPNDVVTELGVDHAGASADPGVAGYGARGAPAVAPVPVASGYGSPARPGVIPIDAPPAGQVIAAGPSQVTWRTAAFAFAFVVVLLVGVGAFLFSANNTYFVGLSGDRVAIFQGRPGGVLWIKPTLVETTELSRIDVPPQFQTDIIAGRDQASVESARQYIANIRDTIAATPSTSIPVVSVPGSSVTPSTGGTGATLDSGAEPDTVGGRGAAGATTSSSAPDDVPLPTVPN